MENKEKNLLKECKVGEAEDCKKEIKNWEKYITDGGYDFDERAENTAKNAQNQIKGLQVQYWAETVRSFAMIEYNMFPKMFGMIDRAWNMQPQWSQSKEEQVYETAKQLYNAKISGKELPRLAKMNVNFRVAQPGIKIIDGLLHANSYIPKAEIRYTTDGSEPTEQSALWIEPIACNAKQVKAKAFYLGKQSVTTLLETE